MKNSNGWPLAKGGSIALALLMSSTSALAQTVPAPEQAAGVAAPSAPAAEPAQATGEATGGEQDASQGLEEIVVTARKAAENLQETPIAITAFTARELEARSLSTVADVAGFAPNVQFGNSPSGGGGGSTAQIYVRGIGQIDWAITTDPGVGFYVDEIYLGRPNGGIMDLIDLERVEVLRGPQGTLFGKNAVGGAISLTTIEPRGTNEGYVEATLGNYDRIDLRGSADIGIVEEALALRVSGASSKRDGHVRRPFAGDRLGGTDRQSARAQLKWTLTPDLSVKITGDVTRQDQDSSADYLVQIVPQAALLSLYNGFVLAPRGQSLTNASVSRDPLVNFGTGPNIDRLDAWGVSGQILWEGPVTLKSITAYRELDNSFGIDADGTPFDAVETTNRVTQDQFSQEFQLIGDAFDGRLSYVGGLYYYRENVQDRGDIRIYPGLFGAIQALPGQLGPQGPTIPCAPPFVSIGCPGNPNNLALDLVLDTLTDLDVTSYAAFANLNLEVTQRLSLNAGIRYTKEKKRAFYDHRRVQSGTQLILTSLSEEFDAWTPRFGIDFKATDDLFLYASASRGFKSGGFNSRPTNPLEVTSFGPELLWSYEAGVKAELFDRRLRLNVAGFYSDYKGIQITAFPAGGSVSPIISNAGTARLKGIEVELTAAPTDGLTLGVAGGYLHSEYRSISPGAVAAGIGLNNRLPRAPKWTGNGYVQYEADLGSAGELTLRADISYTDDQFLEATNYAPLFQEDYTLVNVRATYTHPSDRWELSAFGTNIFDKRYLAAGINNTTGVGFALGPVARPDEYGLSLKVRFR